MLENIVTYHGYREKDYHVSIDVNYMRIGKVRFGKCGSDISFLGKRS